MATPAIAILQPKQAMHPSKSAVEFLFPAALLNKLTKTSYGWSRSLFSGWRISTTRECRSHCAADLFRQSGTEPQDSGTVRHDDENGDTLRQRPCQRIENAPRRERDEHD